MFHPLVYLVSVAISFGIAVRWAYANSLIVLANFSESPVWFIVPFSILAVIQALHFYLIHLWFIGHRSGDMYSEGNNATSIRVTLPVYRSPILTFTTLNQLVDLSLACHPSGAHGVLVALAVI